MFVLEVLARRTGEVLQRVESGDETRWQIEMQPIVPWTRSVYDRGVQSELERVPKTSLTWEELRKVRNSRLLPGRTHPPAQQGKKIRPVLRKIVQNFKWRQSRDWLRGEKERGRILKASLCQGEATLVLQRPGQFRPGRRGSSAHISEMEKAKVSRKS